MYKLEILIDDDNTSLYGMKNGQLLTKEQIVTPLKNAVKSKQTLLIIIPNHIKDISISFVEGLLIEVDKVIPIKDFHKYINISANTSATIDFKNAFHFLKIN